jgi:hypothetical protein
METNLGEPSLCFVIMPFSKTESCSARQWSSIFKTLIKPAVEGAGLGYECVRSVATRGNLVAEIMENLRDAHVVIADLTDRNANVFYELGVRHALRDRTILIAQDRKFIPFDLQDYANHVYKSRNTYGRRTFQRKIRELLSEVDVRPDRSDNPVHDFLKGHAQPALPQHDAPGQTEPRATGEDTRTVATRIISNDDRPLLRATVRTMRTEFSSVWPRKIESLMRPLLRRRQRQWTRSTSLVGA